MMTNSLRALSVLESALVGLTLCKETSKLTQLSLGTSLILLVSNELLDFARHRINVVHDQLVQIGVLVFSVNDELLPDVLLSRITARVHNICNNLVSQCLESS